MADAKVGTLAKRVEAVGAVAFDERSVAVVQARVGGFIEKLYVRAPLDPVVRGQPLAQILAPDWVAAQEEYLALKRSGQADEALRSAARQRLVLLGMPPETLDALDKDGKVQPRITLTAPVSGVIGELGAREGMTVMPGAMLFRINGLSTVWVNAEVPESETSWIKPGATVEATVPAYPDQKFSGHIAAVLPEVNPATRTLKARIEIANPQGRLKPGMYATVNLAPQERHNALLVPSEAVIRTGQRSVVVVADPGPEGRQQFRTVDVEVGAESGGQSEILKGVHPGERVVVSGQFLIDSEASLKATATRLAEATAGSVHHGEGKLERIDRNEVTISHGPMTMDFATPKGVPAELKPGDTVGFDFRQTPQGEFEVVSIARAPAGKP
jgi:Cu(I)/Ag(I) efflux system membrane fusion protein